jgi:hypothetical protein
MKYLILTYETEAAFASRKAAGAESYWGAWRAYTQALSHAGVLRSGAALEAPYTGTTVHTQDGKRRVQDGPFADTKAQLGGFYIIEVENLDVALEWAARCPASADGGVEVRPLVPME